MFDCWVFSPCHNRDKISFFLPFFWFSHFKIAWASRRSPNSEGVDSDTKRIKLSLLHLWKIDYLLPESPKPRYSIAMRLILPNLSKSCYSSWCLDSVSPADELEYASYLVQIYSPRSSTMKCISMEIDECIILIIS